MSIIKKQPLIRLFLTFIFLGAILTSSKIASATTISPASVSNSFDKVTVSDYCTSYGASYKYHLFIADPAGTICLAMPAKYLCDSGVTTVNFYGTGDSYVSGETGYIISTGGDSPPTWGFTGGMEQWVGASDWNNGCRNLFYGGVWKIGVGHNNPPYDSVTASGPNYYFPTWAGMGTEHITNMLTWDTITVDETDNYTVSGGWFSMGSLLSNAYTGFEEAMGGREDIGEQEFVTISETPGGAVSWTGETFTKPFMASGLSVLYEIRYWLVALVMISLIIFFSYRAFRFFRSV